MRAMQAKSEGLLSARLISRGHTGVTEHLAWQSVADVLVDTLVCNSVASASGALWQGTPMLTTLGDAMTTRAVASVVMAITGHGYLVACTLTCMVKCIPPGHGYLVPPTAKQYETELQAMARQEGG